MSEKDKKNQVKTEEEFLQVKDLVVEYTSGGQIIQAVNGVTFNLGKG